MTCNNCGENVEVYKTIINLKPYYLTTTGIKNKKGYYEYYVICDN